MNRKSVLSLPVLVLAFALTGTGESRAAPCSTADFGAVVDQTAQALRDLNLNGSKRFQEKLHFFQEKYKLSEDEIQARAAALQDDKMDEFNREIDSLVNQMDALSQTPNERINCEKLEELKRVRDRLLTVMGQKSGYMLAKADSELDRPAGSPAVTAAKKPDAAVAAGTPPATADRLRKEDRIASNEAPRDEPAAAKEGLYLKPEPKADLEKPAPPPLNPQLPERRPAQLGASAGWTPNNQVVSPPPLLPNQTAPSGGGEQAPTVLAPPPPGEQQLPPPGGDTADNTYTIAEIQEAGRGVFGTITAQFAGAVNYAFQQFGRPNAYITGSEGGAAFLAGLRYGSGKLHSKTMPVTKIYWQGPSLGYDLGAEGSSALFLVYNLEEPDRIYGRFTGIGGSAYVAGGLGVNVLGKGKMVMVPLRTGVGLRIGANLAYLKFTERQTWNPF
ncbi:MAG: EipA family protein [Rhodomicrobiaceae bacterium]